jgi:CRISPR-associated protein Cas2
MKKFVLCYDISEDKTRGKLARICERFGARIQYSVFEFRLKNADYVQFEGTLRKAGLLDGSHSIVLYPLHEDDLPEIRRFGKVRPWQDSYEIL